MLRLVRPKWLCLQESREFIWGTTWTLPALTVAVDSYFWSRFPLWPEFHGLYFNVVQGKSAEWGVRPALSCPLPPRLPHPADNLTLQVSPWHTYFSSSLPKLLLAALPLSIVGALSDGRTRSLLAPALAFVALLSALGHKEWRFVVYVVPVCNVAAARGAVWLCVPALFVFAFCFLFFFVCVWVAVCSCWRACVQDEQAERDDVRARVRPRRRGVPRVQLRRDVPPRDRLNRELPRRRGTRQVQRALRCARARCVVPHAHARTHAHSDPTAAHAVHVHISNLAAQTGASLFLHTHAPPFLPSISIPIPETHAWTYNKTEALAPAVLTRSPALTHLIAEAGAAQLQSFPASAWRRVEGVAGFDGWAVAPWVAPAVRAGLRGEWVVAWRSVRGGVVGKGGVWEGLWRLSGLLNP